MMRGLIFAMSPDGVIGAGGKIPWKYSGDWKRFKRVTLGTTVIMGRSTFESIGRPLSGRRNIVVTSRDLDTEGVERVGTVDEALALAGDDDVWFIGGARIYEEAMKHADVIDVVLVPDRIDPTGAVLAPRIDERVFEPGPIVVHEDDERLTRRVYRRRAFPRAG
ncbi:MAG: dihydrofolate reductase [Polyangiaceae bacterium]|jgi:dihydrofolate reductase